MIIFTPLFITRLIDKLLRTQRTEDRISQVKEEANKKVQKVSKSLHIAGTLQNRILKRTATYYIGKAAGVIR